jgi:hypothetical protein
MPETTGETENGRSISEEAFSLELELRHRPGGGEAEDDVERHRDRRDDQRQLQGGEGVLVAECLEIGAETAAKRLHEDREQRQHQEEAEEADRDQDQHHAGDGAFARRAAQHGLRRLRLGCGRRRLVRAGERERFSGHGRASACSTPR